MALKIMTCLTTYLIIILCELGDKTQLAVLLLTSRNPRKRWLLFAASAIALSLCVLIEVSIGRMLAQHIPPSTINKIAGMIFLIMGCAGLWQEYFKSHALLLSKRQQVYEKAS